MSLNIVITSIFRNIKIQILNRPLVVIIIFYILGIFLSHTFGLNSVLITSIALSLFTVIFIIKSIKNKNLHFLISFFCLISFLLGNYQLLHYNKTNQIELREMINHKGWIYGTVVSSPEISEKGNHYSVIVNVDKIEYQNKIKPIDGNIRLYVSKRDNTAPIVNENIFFFTELLAPDFKEGTFDYELYLKTKNVYAIGFTEVIYPDHEAQVNQNVFSKIMSMCRSLNSFIGSQLEEVFSYDTDACAVIKGILLGDKNDFSQELKDNFSTSGISHIAAVSGLHLNILFGALCGLLGFLRIRKKYVSIVIIPTIIIFSAVTGFSPSVCRATIMLIIYLFALLTKRQYDSITALFISALIILMVNPYSLFNISFILSATATLSIILIYPKIYAKLSPLCKENKILLFLLSSLSISIAVLLGTMPFVAYYFGKISLFSIISNLWIVSLCAPVFILGYAVCILSVFLPKIIYGLILYPLATFIEIIILTTEISSKIEFLSLNVSTFSPYLILPYYLILFIFLLKNKSAHSAVLLRDKPPKNHDFGT